MQRHIDSIMPSPRLLVGLAMAIIVAVPLAAKRPKHLPLEPVQADWRRTATPRDADRLRDWRSALDRARASGNAASIAREGPLLDPDAALDNAAPAPGQYRCRTIKLGGKGSLMTDYVVYPSYTCTITAEGEVMGFAKASGAQRPIGLFFPAENRRLIFLGTMMLGDERRPIEYGRDATRDMAGALERIGPKRWRLILPKPHFESMMDVIELVPA
jgi:Domain of unknown function (DUF4893)